MTLLVALLALLPQDPPPGQKGGTTIHGLVIPVPKTWSRKAEPGGVEYLIPPQDPGPLNYMLVVFPPNKLQGGHWAAHKAMVKALLEQAQWKGGEPVVVHKVEGPGPFIKTEAAGRTHDGQGRTFTLFTAQHDGTMEAILGVNSLDRNVVDPVLNATTFKDPPKSDARPKIVEAYRRIEQKQYATTGGGGLVAGSLMAERIRLRADGVADFSSSYVEGYAASPVPSKVDPAFLSGDYGTWKADGDKVAITRTAGAPAVVYERVNGGLRGGGKDWEPMPRVDGLTLSGRWEWSSPPEEKGSPWRLWIEFTPEGKFRSDGLLRHVAAQVKPPEKGSGTYEIRDWTIFVTFEDGTAWSTDFSVLGRELKPDATILFRTWAFPKAK